MSNSDEILARMKYRLSYQVNACDESTKLLNGIETGDPDVSKRLRIALAEIAAIKAISERKLVEHEIAKTMFTNPPMVSWSDYKVDED